LLSVTNSNLKEALLTRRKRPFHIKLGVSSNGEGAYFKYKDDTTSSPVYTSLVVFKYGESSFPHIFSTPINFYLLFSYPLSAIEQKPYNHDKKVE